MINDYDSRGGYPETIINKLNEKGKLKIVIIAIVVGVITMIFMVTSNSNNSNLHSYSLQEEDQILSAAVTNNECSANDHCCVVGETCPACSAPVRDSNQQRVRRNILDLTYDEVKKVADAFWKMKTTSTEEGQSQYGSFFKNYDYFTVKHYTATHDLRGDQGHFSNAFMTFHSLFELEFEMSLLSIDPSIGALPYWNWNDTVADKSIFTAEYFGSAPGSGENNQVVDGLFADWPISKFNEQTFADNYAKYLTNPSLSTWSGYSKSGYLRHSILANPLLTRYGTNPNNYVNRNCAKPTTFPWFNWYACIEVRVIVCCYSSNRVTAIMINFNRSGQHLLITQLHTK